MRVGGGGREGGREGGGGGGGGGSTDGWSQRVGGAFVTRMTAVHAYRSCPPSYAQLVNVACKRVHDCMVCRFILVTGIAPSTLCDRPSIQDNS